MKPFFCELQAVNEAVNELLIEEEDFAALRESITTYDNFDQLSLAGRCVSFWALGIGIVCKGTVFSGANILVKAHCNHVGPA